MGARIVLTNNPLVLEENGGPPARAVEELGLAAVCRAARDLAQAGYRLVSAPLPPNLPLIRAPYRSLILEKSAELYDVAGLQALEKALERAKTLGRRDFSPERARDAAFIDRELLRGAWRESQGEADST